MTNLLKRTTDSDEDDMKGRFLTFQIDEEMFGLELYNVVEIVGVQPITVLPEMPDYIKGIMNLRGKIIPLMDVRFRFKKPGKEYTDKTCVIVISFDGITIGLIVDYVSEVLTIPDGDIVEKPEIRSNDSCGYIKNIGKVNNKVILLIDCEKLLSEEQLDAVSAQL